MAELEELEQEELDKNLLEIGENVPLPNVPSTLPARPRKNHSNGNISGGLSSCRQWSLSRICPKSVKISQI